MNNALLISLLVVLIIVSALCLVLVVRISPIHTTIGHEIRIDPFGDFTGCEKYLLVDGKTLCFRGNWEFSKIPAIMSTSVETGVEVIFGKATMGNKGYVAVYVEDVGDLGFFWDATGLMK